MDCLEFFDLLDKYENLTEKEISEMDSHAAECEICRYEYEFFKSITNTVSALPCIEPPSDLIAKVNKQIDEMPITSGKFNVFINNVKRNSYRYATAAACLAVGLVVGLNGKIIKESLTNKSTDGVISTTSVTETVPEEQNNTTDTVKPVAPVEEKTEAPAKVKPTQKPAEKPVKAKAKTDTERKKPVTVSVSEPTSAPIATVAPVKAPEVEMKSPAPTVVPVVTTAPTQTPETDKKDVSSYTIRKDDYHVPETAKATEAPADVVDGIDGYALASDECQIAIGYYDVPTDNKKVSKTEEFSEQLIVSVNDVGTITRYMSTLNAMNSGKGYQMALSDFYELLMILDEDEISYRYSSSSHTGDTIIFSIVTY